MGESTTVKVSTEGGSKEVNGDKQVILYRLSQQDSALREIKAAIETRKSDWKPLLGLFGIFIVALGATYWPLSNRIELMEKVYAKDRELIMEKLKNMDRENTWNWDNIKLRISGVEQKQELWMKVKPETKP